MDKKESIKFLKEGGKLKYTLIPPEVNEELAKVLNYGATKYSENNWKKCNDISVFLDAAIRHIEEHRKGNLVDTESGLLHISHAMTNLAFIVYFLRR